MALIKEAKKQGKYISLVDRNLANLDLSKLDLKHADFISANLAHVNFESSDLSNARFSGATCFKTDFSNTILSGAIFAGAEIDKAKFTNSTGLENAVLGNASIYQIIVPEKYKKVIIEQRRKAKSELFE